MALTFDATIGGVASTSYVTLEEAQDYMDGIVSGATWDDAGDDEKKRALMHATRLLDSTFDWFGEVASLDQRLLWPRRGVLKVGIVEGQTTGSADPWRDWAEPFATQYQADEIPDLLKWATAELARQLLISDRTADNDLQSSSVRSLTAGPISLTFGDVSAKVIPDAAMTYAGQLGRPRLLTGGGAVSMTRG